ncbi:hypothetical protein [Lutibacter sp.]
MRKVTLVIAFAILLISCGSVKTLPSPKAITETIQLKSNKNSNFIKANEWMVKTFGNAESVIQFTDKDAGIVKGKYSMHSGQAGSQYTPAVAPYFAMITLRVKDKGAKIEIEPVGAFVITNFMGASYGFTPEQFIKSANALIIDFKTLMNNESANDNW